MPFPHKGVIIPAASPAIRMCSCTASFFANDISLITFGFSKRKSEFSNRFFSSYLEGWKTDRGLVYIIFGPPSSVYISDDSESWNYGQQNNYSSLIFTFDKVNNPFTGKDYHMRRAEYYEVPWYKAVDTWRSGRVVNDSY